MATMHHFTDQNFPAEVLNSATPVLVDFTAVWCGPCRMLDPIIEKLNQEWNGAVKVGKFDIDENPEVTVQYQVMSVPTLILFKAGQPVVRHSGYAAREQLLKKLQAFLPVKS